MRKEYNMNGKWVEDNALKFGKKTSIMKKQVSKESDFILYANPDIAKLIKGLCWCCGRPRIKLNFPEIGWQETCIEFGQKDKKICKYLGEKGCKANGRSDGNCKGNCESIHGINKERFMVHVHEYN